MVPETDHVVKIGIKIAIEEGEITVTDVTIEIIGPITEITVGPEIGTVTEMAIGTAIDQTTEGTIVIKGMVIEVKIAVDLGIELGGIEVVPGKVPNPGVVPKTDTKVEGRVEMMPEIGTGLSLDLDPLLMKVPRETEADVTGAMSMTTLPENVLIIPHIETPIMPKTHF